MHPSGSRNPLRLPHFRSGPYLVPSAFSILPSAFLLAHTPRVPTDISRRDPGYTPVCTRCGSRKPLCLQPFLSLSCTRRSFSCIRCAFHPNRILLSGQRTRLGQAWPAPQLRSRGDTGIPLFLSQRVAVLLRGGAESGSPVQLLGSSRVLGFDIQVSEPLVAPHIPHPLATPATLDRRVKASSCGRAAWATAAPASLAGALTRWFHILRFFDSVAGPAPRGDADRAPLRSADPCSL